MSVITTLASMVNKAIPIQLNRSKEVNLDTLSFFQRTKGKIANAKTPGSIIGTKTALKYGAPTDIFPRFNVSRING